MTMIRASLALAAGGVTTGLLMSNWLSGTAPSPGMVPVEQTVHHQQQMLAKHPAPPFFNGRVRPILAANCFGCHGPARHKGGLRMDSRAAILKGGEHGAAATPGHPEKSLLIKAINYNGRLKMPPRRKLSPAQIGILTQWVKMGLPWPAQKK